MIDSAHVTKVLVIDDDRAIREVVRSTFASSAEYQVEMAATAEAGLSSFTHTAPDVLLLDLHLPEMHGFELFQKVMAVDSRVPVIFITSDVASDVVIHAIRMGAFDYLRKPLQVSELRKMVASAASTRRAADGPVALRVGNSHAEDCFVGSSSAMLDVFKAIGRVANQNVPVLIRGESGTGKELVARALVNHGKRADKPFMSINCAAIPDTLLESELFGHEKGAFTSADRRRVGRFEQCDGGTIFLDEIGDMSPLIQGKVLRLLQEQAFERVGGNEPIKTNARIIAATHQPLELMVSEGKFRQDLLFRLNGYAIILPPLRERRDDIAPLTEYFLRRAKVDMDRPELTGLSAAALQSLESYDWPGNVRELQSVVRQSLLHCVGTVITEECLPEAILRGHDPSDTNRQVAPCGGDAETDGRSPATLRTSTEEMTTSPAVGDEFALSQLVYERYTAGSTNIYAEVIAEVERRLLTQILKLTDGNQSRASEVLGITRGKIRDRVAAYGIKLDTTVSMD